MVGGLSAVDIYIIASYLLSVLVVGVGLTIARHLRMRRLPGQAAGDDGGDDALRDYYLAGQSLPWWALAVADVSSYIDISGTMINTALLYSLGVNGMFVELRGGMCIMLGFTMCLTGKLNRRGGTLTRAAWMSLRFGSKGGASARGVNATVCLLKTALMIAYFAVGGGKFVTEFIDIPDALLAFVPSPEFWGAFGLMLVASTYSVFSGFMVIVWTDVFQCFFIFSAFLYVAVVGGMAGLPEQGEFDVFMPFANSTALSVGAEEGSSRYAFGSVSTTRATWTSCVPDGRLHIPSTLAYSKYNNFGVSVAFYLLSAGLGGAAGPQGGGLQTVLAQKSEVHVGLQVGAAIVLMALRWAFSAGLAVLAIRYTIESSSAIDPEKVLPAAVEHMLPSGGRGFVVAALLAAALTTFDSTVNAGSSYWAVDLYSAFLYPGASAQQKLRQARVASVVIMVAGLALSLAIGSINEIWSFLAMSLLGATAAPDFLSWYWSGCTGCGYVAGLAVGVTASACQFLLWHAATEYTSFCLTAGSAALATVVGSLLSEQVDPAILFNFYCRVRPPGVGWKQVALGQGRRSGPGAGAGSHNMGLGGGKAGGKAAGQGYHTPVGSFANRSESGAIYERMHTSPPPKRHPQNAHDDAGSLGPGGVSQDEADRRWRNAVRMQSAENVKDICCCIFLAFPWQLCLYLLSVSIVAGAPLSQTAALSAAVLVWTFLLYRFWFTRLAADAALNGAMAAKPGLRLDGFDPLLFEGLLDSVSATPNTPEPWQNSWLGSVNGALSPERLHRATAPGSTPSGPMSPGTPHRIPPPVSQGSSPERLKRATM